MFIDKNIEKIKNDDKLNKEIKDREIKLLQNIKSGELEKRRKKIKSGKNLS